MNRVGMALVNVSIGLLWWVYVDTFLVAVGIRPTFVTQDSAMTWLVAILFGIPVLICVLLVARRWITYWDAK